MSFFFWQQIVTLRGWIKMQKSCWWSHLSISLCGFLCERKALWRNCLPAQQDDGSRVSLPGQSDVSRSAGSEHKVLRQMNPGCSFGHILSLVAPFGHGDVALGFFTNLLQQKCMLIEIQMLWLRWKRFLQKHNVWPRGHHQQQNMHSTSFHYLSWNEHRTEAIWQRGEKKWWCTTQMADGTSCGIIPWLISSHATCQNQNQNQFYWPSSLHKQGIWLGKVSLYLHKIYITTQYNTEQTKQIVHSWTFIELKRTYFTLSMQMSIDYWFDMWWAVWLQFMISTRPTALCV